jgi:hypothetical protein
MTGQLESPTPLGTLAPIRPQDQSGKAISMQRAACLRVQDRRRRLNDQISLPFQAQDIGKKILSIAALNYEIRH